ncbi:DUF4245 family protein [Microbacterium deminutum]|uniref:DUF4245 domain-containing protein n=1 Tax=Microbacterium deminutum TaxID=344164 RepID=A0ABN2QUQ8_9MICO
MAQAPRVVAELGRPETPQETADRKAASSEAYRASKTTRNLVAALLATLGVVAVIVLGVPRGTPPAREPINVAAIAHEVQQAEGRTVIVPAAPDDWVVNSAAVEGDSTPAWTVVYAPSEGFLRIAQAFDADDAWPARVLGGAGTDGTVTIGGVKWDRYVIADPSKAGNVSGALGVHAGPDIVLIYGSAGEKTLERAAAAVSAQVVRLREETP